MPSRTRSTRIPTGPIWRVTLAVVVTLAAILAFRMGVGVTDRPGVEAARLATQLYYALGLFVLGDLDLGVPTGGPALGYGMLWSAYFLAPLLTLGAALRRVDPRRRILTVDVLPDHANVTAAQARHAALFLNGDIRNASTRDALQLDRARG